MSLNPRSSAAEFGIVVKSDRDARLWETDFLRALKWLGIVVREHTGCGISSTNDGNSTGNAREENKEREEELTRSLFKR